MSAEDTRDPTQQPLALPASTGEEVTKVSVGGDSMKLKDLGPVGGFLLISNFAPAIACSVPPPLGLFNLLFFPLFFD